MQHHSDSNYSANVAMLIAMTLEVTPEDLAKYNDAAIMLAYDLAPGESASWANLVNTAASMGEINNEQADEQP